MSRADRGEVQRIETACRCDGIVRRLSVKGSASGSDPMRAAGSSPTTTVSISTSARSRPHDARGPAAALAAIVLSTMSPSRTCPPCNTAFRQNLSRQSCHSVAPRSLHEILRTLESSPTCLKAKGPIPMRATRSALSSLKDKPGQCDLWASGPTIAVVLLGCLVGPAREGRRAKLASTTRPGGPVGW